MFNIISSIIVVVFGVIGNIIYFEYRFKKEFKKDTEKETLTKLLLPLYIILKTDELEFIEWFKNDNSDPYEFEADKPERLLKPIKNILDKNLYLADAELQKHSLLFMEWAYSEDSNERFQKLHDDKLEQDKIFIGFRKLVYKKYDEQKKKILK